MRKCAFLFLTLVLVCSALAAESTIGVAGGLTGAWMTGDALEDFQDYLVDYWLTHPSGPYYANPDGQLRVGLAVGVIATMDIGRTVAIQPEIWYAEVRSGMDVGFDYYTTVHEYTWTYRVIELPVLLKWRVPLRGRGSFGRYRSELGPYAGVEAMYLFPPARLEVEDDYGSDSIDWFLESDYHQLALGVVVGTDLRVYFGKIYLGFDVRLHWMATSFDDMGAPFADDTRTPYVRASAQAGLRL